MNEDPVIVIQHQYSGMKIIVNFADGIYLLNVSGLFYRFNWIDDKLLKSVTHYFFASFFMESLKDSRIIPSL